MLGVCEQCASDGGFTIHAVVPATAMNMQIHWRGQK
jgi:hypothetical protein